MIIVGYDGFVIYANPAAAAVVGYTEEQFRTIPYFSYFHPDDIARMQAALPALLEGQSLHEFEVRIRSQDGSYRWYACDLAPDPDRPAFYVIAHDVSNRHQMEESLAEQARQQQAVAEFGRERWRAAI